MISADTYSMNSGEEIPVEIALTVARNALEKHDKNRWEHTQGVAMKASYLADRLPLIPSGKHTLVSAAWLHDIGYTAKPALYQWHPLDGALTLRRWGMPILANLIAWHTTAPEEAELLGIYPMLENYPQPRGLIHDALTYADMTVGPHGEPLSPEERRKEIENRYGANSIQAKAVNKAWPRLTEQFHRVEEALL